MKGKGQNNNKEDKDLREYIKKVVDEHEAAKESDDVSGVYDQMYGNTPPEYDPPEDDPYDPSEDDFETKPPEYNPPEYNPPETTPTGITFVGGGGGSGDLTP